MRIGMTELIVIFIVALFVVGPDRLPAYAKKLGEALAQFRKYADDATKDIQESIVEPLAEAQKPLREAVEPLEELDRAVRGNVKEVRESFAGIKNPRTPAKPPETPPPAPPEAADRPEEPAPADRIIRQDKEESP